MDVRAALRALPQPERLAVRLKTQERTWQEVAARLGVTERKARLAYERGINRLEHSLRSYGPPSLSLLLCVIHLELAIEERALPW